MRDKVSFNKAQAAFLSSWKKNTYLLPLEVNIVQGRNDGKESKDRGSIVNEGLIQMAGFDGGHTHEEMDNRPTDFLF